MNEMSAEERWARIEEKHLALAGSVELLTHDIHAMQKNQERLSAALLSGIAAYLRALRGEEDNGTGEKG